VLAGQTTASEFGGVNVTRTVLNGATHNPWRHGTTPGGSSGGTAAAVSGGLVTLGTGGDGGGSLRIPAGFTGLIGLKATYGRIPLTPNARLGAMTVTHGCLSRSVHDTARWFDVCNGHDPREPLSLPRVGGWEAGLGTHADELRGRRVAIVPDWGAAVVSPLMWELIEEAATALIDECGMICVDGVDTELPRMGAAWSVANSVGLIEKLEEYWPQCADDLTPEIRMAMETAPGQYGADARIKLERRRSELNEAMARIFDPGQGGVDFVMTATNPDVAFDAEGPLPNTFGGIRAGAKINGRLTFPANMYGNPAVSIPAGTVDGLPIGLQVVGRHFDEELLLEMALSVERHRPWPLVAPGVATAG
ncbi:MAG: amidase family protein, partial [Ilumatobacteraceae bacterium]